MSYIYNGGVIQPTYTAKGTKISGIVHPDGTSFNFSDTVTTNTQAVYAGVTESTFAGGASPIRSFYGKCEVDSVPVRARLCIRSRIVDLNLSHWDFALAMTEVFTDATDAEKYYPIVGGVEYNSLPPSGYQYGWVTGNMATGGVTGTTYVGGGGTQKMVVACGRWVDLPFVPRADGEKGAVVLFRAVHNNTGSSYSIKSSNITAGATGADYKSRKFWTRASSTGVNGISTFTNVPSTTDDLEAADIYLEFEFAQPVRSVWGIGDSITANFEYTGWFMQAVWAASNTDSPMIPFLHAISGSALSTFVENLLKYSEVTGSIPTDLVIPCFSPNSTHSSDAQMLADRATLETVLSWAKINGVRVFIWNGCPNNTYTTVQQARLDAQRAWAQEKVVQGMAFRFVEMSRAITSNYNTPAGEKYTTGLFGDAIHPNPAGATRMSPIMASTIKFK